MSPRVGMRWGKRRFSQMARRCSEALAAFTLVALTACAGSTQPPPPAHVEQPTIATIAVTPTVSTAAPADPSARTMRLTIYDDGRSCPANCDAHVVFHRDVNGTANAHLPSSMRPPYEPCRSGQPCRICFDAGTNSCIVVMYRGSGPHRDAFDFTPAFYEEWCAKPDIPARLLDQCRSLASAARRLEGRLNCIRQPDEERCRSVIDAARQAKAADQPLYDECRRIGETTFNRDRPVAQQRSNDCAYEKVATGRNSRGDTWRKLLPGACRDGTFVGRDGLDCCSGSLLSDGPLGIECNHFYLAPPPP